MPNITQVLQQWYTDYPDRVILYIQHADHPDQPVTYRELLSYAYGYTRIFQQQDLKPDEVVVLILQHGLDLISAFLGSILHGLIPSIMPFLTEKLLPERYRADLSSLISITQPSAIVTYPEFELEVRSALQPSDSVRQIILTNNKYNQSAPEFEQLEGMRRSSKDIVLLQHSSGTTGLQKGVALSHQAVFNQLRSYGQAIRLSPKDIIVSWLPLYHDMGLIAGFLMPILSNVPLVLMSPFDWVRAPYRLLQSISHYKGTLCWLPNFAFNFCTQKIRDRYLEGVDLSSLRALINCSEPVRFESHMMFLERFLPYGFRPEALATSYAMAENVFGVTQGGIDSPLNIDEIDRSLFQTKRIAQTAIQGSPSIKMVSCGKPIPNVEIHILSEERRELPERMVGEIALRSDCMLTGYYRRSDETEKAFLDGWYLTGDYGYLADGELFVSGRKKDLIIVGGKNIYPQDIEALAMTVPGVHPGRVSAFGIFNEEAGTEDVVLVAEVDAIDPVDREKIAEKIRESVTRGSAIALRNVYLVNKHWLVKTSSGKNARHANRDKYLLEIQGGF